MTEEQKPRFRSTDVILGREQPRAPGKGAAPATPQRTRKQISLHLTYAQIQILDNLHHRLNGPDRPERIEKSQLGGLALEVLDRLLPRERSFSNLDEVLKYLDTQIPKHSTPT